MSSSMQEAGSFGAADYGMFLLMLVVSAGIGVYYAWADRRKRSSGDFLTGGRSLTALPVAMSLTATTMSSITILSSPAEVYRFGAILGLIGIAYMLSMVITSEIFLPVFYRLGITSSFEYLEMRFNRATRLLGMASFLVQAVMQAGVIVYGPALALSQVTGLNLWIGIASTAAVCTFYCTLGGLKAVIWTDVFQILIMVSGFLAVIIKAVIIQGGLVPIISDAQQGGRLNFWDFDVNPLRRHTFWTLLIGGTFGWTGIYGVNPQTVQRYISCRSLTHARVALYLNLLGICSCLALTVLTGLCLYSIYGSCDPWTAGLVSSPDQLMPHLVMDILTSNPGLPGLFLAAVSSGSLSTVSSCISGLAAVTVNDLIKPHAKVSERHELIISKALSFFFGLLCTAMAGLASLMGQMMQASAVITGVTGGPLLGVFSLGILCPFANSKGALSGLIAGFVAALCVSLGEFISPSPPGMTRPLPLTMKGCNLTVVVTGGYDWNGTSPPTPHSLFTTTPMQNGGAEHPFTFEWRSPSYLYVSVIGAMTAVTVGVIVSLLTGGCRSKVDSRLTLLKKETTFYHFFRFIRGRVVKAKRKQDATETSERRNTNLTFWHSETDIRENLPFP